MPTLSAYSTSERPLTRRSWGVQAANTKQGLRPAVIEQDERRVHGIVSKCAGSNYCSGPYKAWRKAKVMTQSDPILVGSKLDDRRIPTLMLAREIDGRLEYAGSAMRTMPGPTRQRLREICEAIKI